MNGVPVKVGFYIDFPKEDQKVIRKDILDKVFPPGAKSTGLATPEELILWSKSAIAEKLESARKNQEDIQ